MYNKRVQMHSKKVEIALHEDDEEEKNFGGLKIFQRLFKHVAYH